MTTSTLIPAADLLAAGECSPQCLLARELGGVCTCRCGSEYHGLLSGQQVPAREKPQPVRGTSWTAARPWQPEEYLDWWPDDAWWRPWWVVHDRYEGVFDLLEAIMCPRRSATAGIGLCLTAARGAEDASWPNVWAQQDDDGWSAHADIRCAPGWDRFTPDAARVQGEFLTALVSAGRCRAVSPGPAAVAWGFRDRIEAQLAGAGLMELAHGCIRGTMLECIEILTEE
jgi:hypothetical protein